MANINLLPWREESRREKRKEFLGYLAVTLLASVVAVVLWVFLVNQRIEAQQARNALLSKEIASLDEKVKEINELKKRREQVLARMRVIQELQGTARTWSAYSMSWSECCPRAFIWRRCPVRATLSA